MQYSNARILVFAKPPIAGHAKTRLIPALGPEGAATLHSNLVHHTLLVTTDAQLCPVELWRAGEVEHTFFNDCLAHYPIQLQTQVGDDLGQRMYLAFEHALQQCDYAIIVGSDCPSLTREDFAAAFKLLQQGQDCVLSPAEDGGYVLIGLSRNEQRLFEGVDWGTEFVLAQTESRLKELGWSYQTLKAHPDIDRPGDLAELPPPLMPRTSV